jgi:hypothetical protein
VFNITSQTNQLLRGWMMNAISSLKAQTTNGLLAVALALASSVAHAEPISTDATSVSVQWGAFMTSVFDDPGLSALLSWTGDVKASATDLSVPLSSVSVEGKGPAPVLLTLAPDFSAVFGDPAGERMVLDHLRYDTGTGAMTGDFSVFSAPGCAASLSCSILPDQEVFTVTGYKVFRSENLVGDIGGAPLTQGQALQTLLPQDLHVSADLYLDMAELDALAIKAGLSDHAYWVNQDPIYIGHLNVAGLTAAPAIPEPSQGVLMALGLAGLWGIRSRRRSA